MTVIGHVLLACALLIAAVSAAPTNAERYARRVAARSPNRHHSKPPQFIKTVKVSNTTNDDLSSHWAGAAMYSLDPGTWTSVAGTFTVPVPTLSSASGSPQFGSVWVGIDVATCDDANLQVGIDLFVDDTGTTSYNPWWGSFPGEATDIKNLAISAGDTITLSVSTSGSDPDVVNATVVNHSTGVESHISSIVEGAPLCRQDAEWIVEDYSDSVSGEMVPFADFGTVSFVDTSAGTTLNGTVPSGTTISIVDMYQNGQILTSTNVHGSSITISYDA